MKLEIIIVFGQFEIKIIFDSGNEEWIYLMDNNQFDVIIFIFVIGLLIGGLQMQVKMLEIEFKGEMVSNWMFFENNSKMKIGFI